MYVGGCDLSVDRNVYVCLCSRVGVLVKECLSVRVLHLGCAFFASEVCVCVCVCEERVSEVEGVCWWCWICGSSCDTWDFLMGFVLRSLIVWTGGAYLPSVSGVCGVCSFLELGKGVSTRQTPGKVVPHHVVLPRSFVPAWSHRWLCLISLDNTQRRLRGILADPGHVLRVIGAERQRLARVHRETRRPVSLCHHR